MTWAASNKATRAEASLARLMAPTRSVSPMESCFGTLKTELVYQACYKTRDATWHDLFNPGMTALELDITDSASIQRRCDLADRRPPDLNVFGALPTASPC